MEKEFIPYEQALALKELGFDEPCFGVYITSQLFVTSDIVYNSKDIPICKAPLYQQAFRWFSKKYDCHHTIQRNKKYVGIAYSSVVNYRIDEFNTYEEAELECLKKLIEIIKNK